MSAMGPIAALDMLYGHRASIASGNVFMGHRTGFLAATRARHLKAAGFQTVRVPCEGHFVFGASGVKAPLAG